MKDQPSNSDDKKEPVRPKTIPDDFIWVPESQGWIAPGEPSTFDVEAWRREFEEERRRGEYNGGLISVDELRAAGALDVPPSWRKSLGGEERDLFSDLSEDDERPEK